MGVKRYEKKQQCRKWSSGKRRRRSIKLIRGSMSGVKKEKRKKKKKKKREREREKRG
ncbi:hypothetical protein Fmac_019539 [Flemingia macrophylla]|uniref:Uncharacterized protein n=1 Tax=Flemingia macrophylla TaxID=520843 RepID=A0ABD1M843_9FABA